MWCSRVSVSEVYGSLCRMLQTGPQKYIVAIAQSVSALDFNFERAVEGSILTAGKKVESEKFECNNSGYKLTDLTWWP